MSTPAISMTTALLNAFYITKKEETPNLLIEKLSENFSSKDNFIKKIKALDSAIGEFKIPDDIGELLFDILLFNFFSEDSQRLGEQFFESKEWVQIEDVIIDRGTELMNILLYLQECKDSGIQFSIDDYLDEYLIGEDDFDSEEHEVYEAVIKNRDEIVLGDLDTMVEISKANAGSPLGDQLLPVLLFFETKNSIDKKQNLILKEGTNPAFQSSFLAVLSSF
ncbi:MAG: hypothetical protein ACKVQB_05210 [Bacteroidia bacterium]